MAINTAPVFPKTIITPIVQFANADGTALKTLYTALTDGARIDKITIITDETVANVARVVIGNGTIDNLVADIAVPAGAGTDGGTTAPVIIDKNTAPWFDPAWFLQGAYILKMQFETAVVAAKTVYVQVQGGSYA